MLYRLVCSQIQYSYEQNISEQRVLKIRCNSINYNKVNTVNSRRSNYISNKENDDA